MLRTSDKAASSPLNVYINQQLELLANNAGYSHWDKRDRRILKERLYAIGSGTFVINNREIGILIRILQVLINDS